MLITGTERSSNSGIHRGAMICIEKNQKGHQSQQKPDKRNDSKVFVRLHICKLFYRDLATKVNHIVTRSAQSQDLNHAQDYNGVVVINDFPSL
jgi:hypothetical protein